MGQGHVVLGVMAVALLSGVFTATETWFRASPTSIVPGVTPKLSLTCTLADYDDISSFVVDIKQNGLLLIKDNYSNITGPEHTFPKDVLIIRNVTNKRVQLTYTWALPDATNTGSYSCNVDGFDGAGNFFVSDLIVNVTSREPSEQELWSRLKKEQEVNQEQEKRLTHLQSGLESQTGALRHLHQQLIQATAQLSRAVKDARHMERGTVACGNSVSWTSNAMDRTRSKLTTVKFTEAYSGRPQVFVSVNYLNVYTNKPIRYYAYVDNVNTTHATLGCREYERYGASQVPWLQVDWVSFPSSL